MSQTKAELIEPQGNVAFDTNTLYVDAGNNRVGIGTASPTALLSLDSATVSDFRQSVAGTLQANIYSSSSDVNVFAVQANPLRFGTSNTERARIDSSGRLLVGTSSARSVEPYGFGTNGLSDTTFEGIGDSGTNTVITVCSNNNTEPQIGAGLYLARTRGTVIGSNTIVQSGDTLGTISFAGADGTDLRTRGASIIAQVDGTPGANDMPGRLVFSTTADGASSPTERMRISSAGVHSVYSSTNNSLVIRNSLGANTSDDFINCLYGATAVVSGGTTSFKVLTNGNVQNTNNSYTAISDIKLKENIVDAKSQWNDLKALQVRNYNLKEGQTHTQIGLVAQEVELVSPGLVTESPDRDAEGNDLGTVTKSVNYSVLYMKAVKALQEAMERIETLEAKVAALESA